MSSRKTIEIRERLRQKLGKSTTIPENNNKETNPVGDYKENAETWKRILLAQKNAYEIKEGGGQVISKKDLSVGHKITGEFITAMRDAIYFDASIEFFARNKTVEQMRKEWNEYRTASINTCHVVNKDYCYYIEKPFYESAFNQVNTNPSDYAANTVKLLLQVEELVKPVAENEEIFKHFGRLWIAKAWTQYLMSQKEVFMNLEHQKQTMSLFETRNYQKKKIAEMIEAEMDNYPLLCALLLSSSQDWQKTVISTSFWLHELLQKTVEDSAWICCEWRRQQLSKEKEVMAKAKLYKATDIPWQTETAKN